MMGLYGNAHSWIPSPIPHNGHHFAGVRFASAVTFDYLAIARDTRGQEEDRFGGTKTLEYTMDAGASHSGTAWLVAASFQMYSPTRQVFSITPAVTARGIRILIGNGATSSVADAIDEIEVYYGSYPGSLVDSCITSTSSITSATATATPATTASTTIAAPTPNTTASTTTASAAISTIALTTPTTLTTATPTTSTTTTSATSTTTPLIIDSSTASAITAETASAANATFTTTTGGAGNESRSSDTTSARTTSTSLASETTSIDAPTPAPLPNTNATTEDASAAAGSKRGLPPRTPPLSARGQAVRAAARAEEDALIHELVLENATSGTRRAPGITITARRITPAMLERGGRGAVFSISGGGAAAAVPAAVVRQVGGDLVATVTVFDPGFGEEFGAPTGGGFLAAEPVEVRIVTPSNASDISFPDGLAEPINVTLLVAGGRGAKCAFWDDAAGNWSSVGLEAVGDEDGVLVCATPHLTIFAAILSEIGAIYACSNSKVLSADGLRRLGQGLWWCSPAALLLWSVILVQGATLLAAQRLDRRSEAENPWCPDTMLTDNKAFARRGLVNLARKKAHHLCSGDLAKSITAFCIRQSLAVHQKVLAADVPIMMRGGAALPSIYRVHSGLSRVSSTAAERFFHWSTWGQRVWFLFAAMHPWVLLTRFTIAASATTRALLLATRLLLALMLCALFFEGTGEALSVGSAEACAGSGLGRRLFQSALVGAASALLSALPLLLLWRLHRHRFVYREYWSEAERRSYLRWRALRGWLAWALSLGSCGFCTLYLAAFLANINETSRQKWLISATVSLLDELLIVPMQFAVLYACVATAVFQWRPAAVSSACRDLELAREKAAERGKAAERDIPVLLRTTSWASVASTPRPKLTRAVAFYLHEPGHEEKGRSLDILNLTPRCLQSSTRRAEHLTSGMHASAEPTPVMGSKRSTDGGMPCFVTPITLDDLGKVLGADKSVFAEPRAEEPVDIADDLELPRPGAARAEARPAISDVLAEINVLGIRADWQVAAA